MIYWLNGAYGVGKTTVSKALRPLLRSAHILDLELLGDGIRDNHPAPLFCETFEEYPLWLDASYRLLKDLHQRYDGDVIAPMTLLREASYDAILGRLGEEGVPVRYIFLDADEPTLRHRLIDLGREEPDSWCVGHIPACLEAQAKDTRAIHIDTVNRTPAEIAAEIAAL